MPKGDVIIISKATTVSEYLLQWYNDYCVPRLARNTLVGYYNNIVKHINPAFGDVPLRKLKPDMVQGLYSQLHDKGLSNTAVLYVHATLRKALNTAVKQQLLNDNVVCHVYAPRKNKFTASTLDEAQILRLLDACRYTEIYIPVLLAATLGLRRGEILGLSWDAVDLQYKTLEVRQSVSFFRKEVCFSSPKTASSLRTILLPDFVCRELSSSWQTRKCQPDSRNLVTLRSDGGMLSSAVLTKQYKAALKSAGLPNIRFHDLRHSNATLLFRKNIPAKIVQARLGHSKVSTTLDMYTHVITEMQAPAAAAIDSIFL